MGSEVGDADSINDEEEYEGFGGKNGLIFLIDSRQSMFIKDVEDDDGNQCSRFNLAIKCLKVMLMNKMVAKNRDVVGAVLFGTDKADPKTNTKHVSLLSELNYPDAPAIKQLDQLMNDKDGLDFQRTHGSSDDFLIADALWFCSSLFSQSGINLEGRKILLFTNEGDPHSDDPDKAHKARKRAKDLHQIKITLEVIPLGEGFDFNSIFYPELIDIVNGTSDCERLNPSTKLTELLERVNRLDFRCRRYSKLKWNLGNGVCLGVSLYTTYRETTVPAKATLNRATNEPVKRVRQTYDQLENGQHQASSGIQMSHASSLSWRKPLATGELLLPSDIIEYASIGGEDIVFSSEEKEMIKKVMEPGITLLGFKPASVVGAGIHCGEPAFAYAEETLIRGSRELMKALVERCVAKQKVALCCITPRNRALTKYVYLLPTEDKYNNNNHLITPYGFHVIPLPFCNSTREMKFEPSPQIDEERVDIAKQLIKKLKIKFDPYSFKNPKLEQFWSHLEALALDYESPTVNNEEDSNEAVRDERLGQRYVEFNNAFSLTGTAGTVAKRSQTAGGSTPKRAKVAEISEDTISAIKAAIGTKKVEKFTVPQLKEFLAHYNKDASKMKKADLVNAVNNLEL